MIECTTFEDKTKLVSPDELSFRPSVYGFIVKDNTLLVMKSKGVNKWTLPGGGIEKGELSTEALKREVKEEVGIDIAVTDFADFKESFFYYNPWQEAWHGLLFFYNCQVASGEVSDVEKINGVETGSENPQWVDIKTLKAQDFVASLVDIYHKWAKQKI